ncbi:hypothetical protein TNCT_523901 [Trichonephila clavata]|uniref:Uncharacterized protein n=1 Tax=Trichonephila clavata TaxID=2740835 RepID=A0A8X6LH64_TRICU|nr:hypothetical protein TNCT_523901 [Trichonephila clavata]
MAVDEVILIKEPSGTCDSSDWKPGLNVLDDSRPSRGHGLLQQGESPIRVVRPLSTKKERREKKAGSSVVVEQQEEKPQIVNNQNPVRRKGLKFLKQSDSTLLFLWSLLHGRGQEWRKANRGAPLEPSVTYLRILPRNQRGRGKKKDLTFSPFPKCTPTPKGTGIVCKLNEKAAVFFSKDRNEKKKHFVLSKDRTP